MGLGINKKTSFIFFVMGVFIVVGFVIFLVKTPQLLVLPQMVDVNATGGQVQELVVTSAELSDGKIVKAFYDAETKAYQICIQQTTNQDLMHADCNWTFELDGVVVTDYTFLKQTKQWRSYVSFILENQPQVTQLIVADGTQSGEVRF